ncbi:MAG TPA: 4-hydroxy-tetrahydrodipicolinate reductase [Actinomycetota bacterium]|jgi:4-hydroxy-tetrahydrodipicolinate reductase|nr:4-hydroxy-tetrahydrodipicolinate reductase [Actinomycetota bacterium]
MRIKVGVLGAAGRMGRAVGEAVSNDPELELVARVDPSGGEGIATSIEALVDAGAQVAIDFTQPDSAFANASFCLEHGIHCVVGTTGMSQAELDKIEELATSGDANAFVAPNFSIGAVLMMHLAKQAARHMGSCEIVEMHHNQKLDAPSGTAMRTAREIAAVWNEHGRPPGGEHHPDEEEKAPGARGGEVDGIHVHGVRLLGGEAHQEVIFGALGQTLTIRHDAMNRSSYMPGILLAVKSVASRPGLTVGLEHLLDL